MGTKSNFINLRLDSETKEILANLADAMQISLSGIVRQLIEMGLAEIIKLDYVKKAYARRHPDDDIVTKYLEQRSGKWTS